MAKLDCVFKWLQLLPFYTLVISDSCLHKHFPCLVMKRILATLTGPHPFAKRLYGWEQRAPWHFVNASAGEMPRRKNGAEKLGVSSLSFFCLSRWPFGVGRKERSQLRHECKERGGGRACSCVYQAVMSSNTSMQMVKFPCEWQALCLVWDFGQLDQPSRAPAVVIVSTRKEWWRKYGTLEHMPRGIGWNGGGATMPSPAWT